MYKNAEYQQSQCKKCRSKKPVKIVDRLMERERIKFDNAVKALEALSKSNVVELKPCERDNQPMVKFPITSEPTELERGLLKSLYVRTYPRDKEGAKRSYKFMWNKLHKRGLV